MSIFTEGFEIIAGVLSSEEVELQHSVLTDIDVGKRSGGVRNADKKYASIKTLALSEKLVTLAQRYLDGMPAVVRVILFEKSAQNNWLVAWHQDRTLAVSKRFDDDQWGPWSVKEGVLHVQPPPQVLDKMITLRVHLDDAHEENGCLRVIPRSHHWGLLTPAEIHQRVSCNSPVSCVASAGSVLVMRPHLLHASSKAISPARRRVIHIEYSSYQLPLGVAWV